MATKNIRIPVQLDTKDAKKDASLLSKDLGSAFNSIKSVSVGMAAGIAAAGKAIAVMSEEIGKSIDLASKQQVIERNLETSLRLRTANYKQITADLIAYNGELQRTTNIDADALADLQRKLTLMGVESSLLKEVTQATIGLAQITGGDLLSSSNKVVQVLRGKVKALEEVGITGKDTADIMKQLTSASVLASEATRTFDGRLKQIGNSADDNRKLFGRLITDNRELNQSLDDLNGTTRAFGGFLEANKEPLSSIISLIGALASALINITTHLIEFNTWMIKSVYAPAVEWASDRIAPLMILKAIANSAKDAKTEVKALSSAMDAAVGQNSVLLPETPQQGPLKTPGQDSVLMDPYQRADMEEKNAKREAALARQRELLKQEYELLGQRDALDAQIRNQELSQQQFVQETISGAFAQKTVDDLAKREADRIAIEQNSLVERQKLAQASLNAEDQKINEMESLQQQEDMIYGAMAQGIGSHFAAMISNIASESHTFLEALGTFVGGLLTMIGNMLLQLGIAAVAGATLGTVIPFLAPATGGPAGIAAGIAAIAIGGGLIGVGSWISAASAPSKPAKPAGRTGTPSNNIGTSYFGDQRLGEDRDRSTSTTIIIQGNAPLSFVGSSEEEAGRVLAHMLDRADRLRDGV